jgi:cytochrome c oxidase subunit 4
MAVTGEATAGAGEDAVRVEGRAPSTQEAPPATPPAQVPTPSPVSEEPGGPGRHRIYITVFAALAALTAMELGVNRLVSVKSLQVELLVPMMLAKAALVVLYYMHLRYESRVLRWAVLVPVAMAVFFAIVVTRGGG